MGERGQGIGCSVLAGKMQRAGRYALELMIRRPSPLRVCSMSWRRDDATDRVGSVCAAWSPSSHHQRSRGSEEQA